MILQPNCSECAVVLFKDKLTEEHLTFLKNFADKRKIKILKTPKGNYSIELNVDPEDLSLKQMAFCSPGEDSIKLKEGEWLNPSDKFEIAQLADDMKAIADYLGLAFEEGEHYHVYRDDSYYSLLEDKEI